MVNKTMEEEGEEEEDKDEDEFGPACQDIPVVFFGGLQLSLFSAPHHHWHQFGPSLLLPTPRIHCIVLAAAITLLLPKHCCHGTAAAGLEYLQSLKTVPSPLIFYNCCFSPILVRRKLSTMNLWTGSFHVFLIAHFVDHTHNARKQDVALS